MRYAVVKGIIHENVINFHDLLTVELVEILTAKLGVT